jgi:hypothetical protein
MCMHNYLSFYLLLFSLSNWVELTTDFERMTVHVIVVIDLQLIMEMFKVKYKAA